MSGHRGSDVAECSEWSNVVRRKWLQPALHGQAVRTLQEHTLDKSATKVCLLLTNCIGFSSSNILAFRGIFSTIILR